MWAYPFPFFHPLKFGRKAGGKDAGGEGKKADAQHGNAGGQKATDGGDRVNIAIAHGGECGDTPPHGSRDA